MTRHTASLSIATSGPLGPLGERLAVAHLTGDDRLDVLATNWAVRSGPVRGELDVVAIDRRAGTVVVVEVKTRRSDAQGGPLVAVTGRKQAKVRALTSTLLREAELPFRRVRFDVVGVWLPGDGSGRLEHLEGAF